MHGAPPATVSAPPPRGGFLKCPDVRSASPRFHPRASRAGLEGLTGHGCSVAGHGPHLPSGVGQPSWGPNPINAECSPGSTLGLVHTHMHTPMHTDASAQMCILCSCSTHMIHIHVCTCTHVWTRVHCKHHTCAHMQTDASAQMHTRAHIHAHMCTHARAAHVCTCADTRHIAGTCTHVRAHACTCTRTCLHTCSCCAHTCTHVLDVFWAFRSSAGVPSSGGAGRGLQRVAPDRTPSSRQVLSTQTKG